MKQRSRQKANYKAHYSGQDTQVVESPYGVRGGTPGATTRHLGLRHVRLCTLNPATNAANHKERKQLNNNEHKSICDGRGRPLLEATDWTVPFTSTPQVARA